MKTCPAVPTRDNDMMAFLRARQEADERIVRVPGGVAVLDPVAMQSMNVENYVDTTLPNRFVDVLRRRTSPKVSWKEVRAAWMPNLKRFAQPDEVAALDGRLRTLIESRLDQPLDLTRAIQAIFSRALIPIVIDDLDATSRRRLEADQDQKIARLTMENPRPQTLRECLYGWRVQIHTTRIVRRLLRARASGRRPRRTDLADPIVDLLPRLGADRAAYAVTTVLTAIAGPPGAVAVCLLLELIRRPDWATRLADEHRAVDAACFFAAPARMAPRTHRFVKETLRCWSSPLVLSREARATLSAGDKTVESGQRYLASPYLQHHDPRSWSDPEVFDPDRWRTESVRGPSPACAYAPFGWAPTSCIGAGLGLTELLLLARLFVSRYRLEPESLDDVTMHLSAVPVPHGFRGRLIRTQSRSMT